MKNIDLLIKITVANTGYTFGNQSFVIQSSLF